MSTLIPSQVENRMISAGDPYPPGWEQEPETEEEYQERVEATKDEVRADMADFILYLSESHPSDLESLIFLSMSVPQNASAAQFSLKNAGDRITELFDSYCRSLTPEG